MLSLEKYQAGLVGLAIGENYCKKNSSEQAEIALLVCDCLLANSEIEEYEKKFTEGLGKWSKNSKHETVDLTTYFAAQAMSPFESDSCSQLAFSLPIGFYYHDNIPNVINFARSTAASVTTDSPSQCCTVACSLMALYAFLDVPIGLWGNELISFVQGIDDELLKAIKETTYLCAQHYPVDTFNKYMAAYSEPVLSTCGALYSCMFSPLSYDYALKNAYLVGGNKAANCAVVGGCMGSKLGISKIPTESLLNLPNREKFFEMGQKLFVDKKPENQV